MTDTFTVLFVCTGNICRSPLAEQVFRSRFVSPSVAFESAGTAALAGAPLHPQSAVVAAGLGVVGPRPHAARQLSADLVDRADLVLTMSRRHRAEVVRLLPRANRYAFTLREFTRLAENAAAEPGLWDAPAAPLPQRLRAALPLVAARRPFAPAATAEEDGIPDPYGRDDSAFELTGALIDDAASRLRAAIARVIAGQGRSTT